MKKISLSELEKVLTPKEMKNLTGGSVECSIVKSGGCEYNCCFNGSGDDCTLLGCSA